jgi:hypothetical protein
MTEVQKYVLDNYFSDKVSEKEKQLWLETNTMAKELVSIFEKYLKSLEYSRSMN